MQMFDNVTQFVKDDLKNEPSWGSKVSIAAYSAPLGDAIDFIIEKKEQSDINGLFPIDGNSAPGNLIIELTISNKSASLL